MRLQLALDGTLKHALEILHQTHAHIDIAEIGTPLIYREGMRAIHAIREQFPALTLLADLKIVDAGQEEAEIAFEAGAHLVTVLGIAPDKTIQGAVRAAKACGGQIVADTIQIANLSQRVGDLLSFGCDFCCIHTGVDLQAEGHSPFAHLAHIRQHLPDAPLAVAGGLTPQNLHNVIPLGPDIIVVGGSITKAADPLRTIQHIREQML